MKVTIWSLVSMLLVFTACGDDGEGSSKLYIYVYNGEQPSPGTAGTPAAGAKVFIYSSSQAWIDGDEPIKKFTTDNKGRIASNFVVPDGAVLYAEFSSYSGGPIYNNWPAVVMEPNWNEYKGSLSGNAIVYNSFWSLYEGVIGDKFVLSNVTSNGTSIFNSVSQCSKDNYITLDATGDGVLSEGLTVCDGGTSTALNIFVPSSKIASSPSNGFYNFGMQGLDGATFYINTTFTEIQTRALVGGNEIVNIYTRAI